MAQQLKICVIPEEINFTFTNPHVELAYHMALQTALRRAELLNVKVSDLYDSGVFISRQKIVVKGGKIKEFHITRNLQAKIEDYIKEHRPKGGNDYLFPSTVGVYYKARRHISSRTLNRWWRETQERSGVLDQLRDLGCPVKYFRWHDLRHTAITRFYKEHKNMYLARAFARHSNVSITEQYIHYSFNELAAALEKMDGGGDEL